MQRSTPGGTTSRRIVLAPCFLALAAACATTREPQPAPTPARWIDHHVHVLSPRLVEDWKSLGVPFSRPDEHYTGLEALLATGDLEGALLVPMAHFYASGEMREALELDLETERARAQAENDYVANLAANSAFRAVALASVDLLRPYALDELQRAREQHTVAGAKLHLRSAGFDFATPEHRQALERVAAWVASFDGLLLLHLDADDGLVEGPLDAPALEATLEHAFGPHPNLRVLVAHMGGSGGFDTRVQRNFDACMRWLAAERARGRPRAEFHFDLSAALMLRESEGVPASSDADCAALASALRRAGFERVHFGSDYPVFAPAELVDALETRLGLTRHELQRLRLSRVREFWHPRQLGPGR
jgi:predicted TIM-barrel fold metal-dependent hydrolase